MAICLRLTDAAWVTMAPRPVAMQPKAGSPPELRDRLCIAAVLSGTRPGLPWRDKPREGGHGDAVDNRCRRWEAGAAGGSSGDASKPQGATHVCLEIPMVRAYQHAAGARKNTAGKQPRLGGCAQGGLSTNSHASCLDEQPHPACELTSGARHDAPLLQAVLD